MDTIHPQYETYFIINDSPIVEWVDNPTMTFFLERWSLFATPAWLPAQLTQTWFAYFPRYYCWQTLPRHFPTYYSQFGPIESVVMVPKKSYSFLVFARYLLFLKPTSDYCQRTGRTLLSWPCLPWMERCLPMAAYFLTLASGWAEWCRAPLFGLCGISSTGERPLAGGQPSRGPQVLLCQRLICIHQLLHSRLLPDFVTEEEETELLETFHWEENDGKMKHRQVKQRLTF